MKKRVRQTLGFTLVEVLVAITVMALLAIISYRGIAQSVIARTHVQDEMRQTRDLFLALGQLERDLTQRLPNVALTTGAVATDVLPRALQVSAADPAGIALTILRATPGAQGGMQAQRVLYTVSDGALIRSASRPSSDWPIDQTQDRVAFAVNARKLSARVSVSGVWYELPLAQGAIASSATGLEIVLECDQARRYVKVIAL